MKVLLVDDDHDLLDVTAYALRREGFDVSTATDGLQALQRWQVEEPDVVILDVSLPRLSGFEVCRQIRQEGSTPIILLTALSAEEHVLAGFRQGADDYVTKPFSPRQLVMRIRAIWRRTAGAGEPEPARELRIGNLILDLEAHEVRTGNCLVKLTPIEFRLLQLLVSNEGRVIGLSRLVDYAWGYSGGDVGLLKTHVSHIRKKLQAARNGSVDIRVVPGVGYRLSFQTTADSNGQTPRPLRPARAADPAREPVDIARGRA